MKVARKKEKKKKNPMATFFFFFFFSSKNLPLRVVLWLRKVRPKWVTVVEAETKGAR